MPSSAAGACVDLPVPPGHEEERHEDEQDEQRRDEDLPTGSTVRPSPTRLAPLAVGVVGSYAEGMYYGSLRMLHDSDSTAFYFGKTRAPAGVPHAQRAIHLRGQGLPCREEALKALAAGPAWRAWFENIMSEPVKA